MNGYLAAQNHNIADLSSLRTHLNPVANDTDAGGIDIDLVSLTSVNHFRITGHQRDPGPVGRALHRDDDSPEFIHSKSLFNDECRREVKRASATHCQVVDRPVNGQFSNVTPGEHDRTYNV